MSAADWYRRNYPDGPDHDQRCLEVLTAWEQLYNLPITGRARNDGGIREWPSSPRGVMVRPQPGVSLATYDDGALTRLVLAAHEHCCRVDIISYHGRMCIAITPRDPESDHQFMRHPTLKDLREQVQDRAIAKASNNLTFEQANDPFSWHVNGGAFMVHDFGGDPAFADRSEMVPGVYCGWGYHLPTPWPGWEFGYASKEDAARGGYRALRDGPPKPLEPESLRGAAS